MLTTAETVYTDIVQSSLFQSFDPANSSVPGLHLHFNPSTHHWHSHPLLLCCIYVKPDIICAAAGCVLLKDSLGVHQAAWFFICLVGCMLIAIISVPFVDLATFACGKVAQVSCGRSRNQWQSATLH